MQIYAVFDGECLTNGSLGDENENFLESIRSKVKTEKKKKHGQEKNDYFRADKKSENLFRRVEFIS